jgi:hypothetical protein
VVWHTIKTLLLGGDSVNFTLWLLFSRTEFWQHSLEYRLDGPHSHCECIAEKWIHSY